jgi:hypothetical protein
VLEGHAFVRRAGRDKVNRRFPPYQPGAAEAPDGFVDCSQREPAAGSATVMDGDGIRLVLDDDSATGGKIAPETPHPPCDAIGVRSARRRRASDVIKRRVDARIAASAGSGTIGASVPS